MRDKTSSEGPPAQRRILIVDDHPLVRRGLAALIDNEPDLMVCATAAGHREGSAAVAASRPDLVIANLSLADSAGSDGLALVEEIRSADEGLPVLVLSMHDAPHYARRAFRSGASGYVTKQEMTETLLIAMRCVLGGETYVSPKIGEALRTS